MSNPYNGTGCGYDGCGYGIGVPAPSAAAPLLLDNLPQFRIAVATKKLRTDYSGNCLQVRRSSDSTTNNFGFVDGVVDSAGYDTFCGAGNGFVASWYDQSGSGNNLTQATTTVQPAVVTSGVVEANASGVVGVLGSQATHLNSGTLTYTRPFHRFCVVTFNSNTAQFVWDGQSDNVGSLETTFSSPNYRASAWNGSLLHANIATSLVGAKAIIEVLYNGASSRVRVNAGTASTGTTGTGTLPTKVRLMNAGSTSSFGLRGWMHAFLEYDGELTTEQVTAVRDGLNELYGVF